jgi:hypothetical protein
MSTVVTFCHFLTIFNRNRYIYFTKQSAKKWIQFYKKEYNQ